MANRHCEPLAKTLVANSDVCGVGPVHDDMLVLRHEYHISMRMVWGPLHDDMVMRRTSVWA